MSVQFISAEELKQRILDRGRVWSGEELDIFAAAVIREASVGTAIAKQVRGYMCNDMQMVLIPETLIEFEGRCDLIPHKETP